MHSTGQRTTEMLHMDLRNHEAEVTSVDLQMHNVLQQSRNPAAAVSSARAFTTPSLSINTTREEQEVSVCEDASSDEFMMYKYKIVPCQNGASHDHGDCPFAHCLEKARRRDVRAVPYIDAACPDFRKGTCKRGDICPFAHGVFEAWLHPARYRTKLCRDGSTCDRPICFFAHSLVQLREAEPMVPSALVSKTLAAKLAAKVAIYVQAGTPLQPRKTSVAQLSPRGPLSPAPSQQSLCSAMRRCPSADRWRGDSCNGGNRMHLPPCEQIERFGSSDSLNSDAWGSEPFGRPNPVIGSWGSVQSSAASSAPNMQVRLGMSNVSNVAAHLPTFAAECPVQQQQFTHLAPIRPFGQLPPSPPPLEPRLSFAMNISAAGSTFDTVRNTAPNFEATPFAHLEPMHVHYSLPQMNSAPSPVSSGFGAWSSPAHSPVPPQAPLFILPQWEATPSSQNLDLSGVRAIWDTPLSGAQRFISAWSVSQVAN